MAKDRHIVACSHLNRYRYARHKIGKTVEEIAAEDGVKLETIQQSIEDVETQYAMLTLDEVERAEADIVLYTKDYRKNALTEALQADRVVYSTQGTNVGEIVAREADHEIRLQAVDSITKIVAASGARHAKGSTTAIQVNQNNSVTQNNSAVTYEERLRKAHERRQLSEIERILPPDDEVIEIQGEPN